MMGTLKRVSPKKAIGTTARMIIVHTKIWRRAVCHHCRRQNRANRPPMATSA